LSICLEEQDPLDRPQPTSERSFATMLVLSREQGEQIVIGQDIIVTVVGIEGNRIKLAIQAPIEQPVLREELCLPGKPPSAYSPQAR
jgi:carbon storage regulator